jgi:hypothetical protein
MEIIKKTLKKFEIVIVQTKPTQEVVREARIFITDGKFDRCDYDFHGKYSQEDWEFLGYVSEEVMKIGQKKKS